VKSSHLIVFKLALTLWSTNFIYIKFKNQVHTSSKTRCLHYKDRPLMKCNEPFTVVRSIRHTHRCSVWRKFRVLVVCYTMWKAYLIWWLLCYVAYYPLVEFTSRFVPKILYAFLTSSRRTTYPAHSSLLEFIDVLISAEEQNLWISSLRVFFEISERT
jgi:hypothetical protein